MADPGTAPPSGPCAPSRVPSSSGLPRHLGLADGVAILVGIILGSGIFVAPAAVARAAPGAGLAVMLWLAGGAVAAAGALCYAECSARVPRTGGFYVFYRRVFGPGWAFVAGWTALLVTYPASIAAVAAIFTDYLEPLLEPYALPRGWAALGAIGLLAVLNVVGLKTGVWTQRLVTLAKVTAVGLLCAAAWWFPGAATGGEPWMAWSGDLSWLLGALVLVLWTYDGWSDVTLVAGEIRRPARNLVLSVLLGCGLLAVLYVWVHLSVLRLLGAGEASGSSQVFADAMERALGDRAGRTVAALIVVSTLGAMNGILLTASRLGYAVAAGGQFWKPLASLHPRWKTPARSVWLVAAVSGLYALTSGFDALLTFFSATVWVFYGSTAVAFVLLRRRREGEPLAWRAPGGFLSPALLLAVSAAMTLGNLVRQPRPTLAGFLLIISAALAYARWGRLARTRG